MAWAGWPPGRPFGCRQSPSLRVGPTRTPPRAETHTRIGASGCRGRAHCTATPCRATRRCTRIRERFVPLCTCCVRAAAIVFAAELSARREPDSARPVRSTAAIRRRTVRTTRRQPRLACSRARASACECELRRTACQHRHAVLQIGPPASAFLPEACANTRSRLHAAIATPHRVDACTCALARAQTPRR